MSPLRAIALRGDWTLCPSLLLVVARFFHRSLCVMVVVPSSFVRSSTVRLFRFVMS
jgi:hypothetical protein